MSRRILGAMIVFAWAGTAAASEAPWAVVGVRSSDGAPVREQVETLRGLLGSADASTGVLGEAETKARLGLATDDLDSIQRRIEGAELYWFQLELASARESLELALRALSTHVGSRAAERNRLTRFLLAEIHLAEGGPDAEARAARVIEPIAKLRPADGPDPKGYSAELLSLFDRVKDEAAHAPGGWLRVECESACPGSQVWVDASPRGAAGERIELPAGRYRVMVGDGVGQPRSLLREVEVVAGEEAEVHVDLALESTADPEDGPAFAARGSSARDAAHRLAEARLPVSRLVIYWTESDGRTSTSFALLAEPGSGQIVREVASSGSAREALERLAARLLGRAAVADATEGDGASAVAAPVAVGDGDETTASNGKTGAPVAAGASVSELGRGEEARGAGALSPRDLAGAPHGDARDEARLEAQRLLATDPEPAGWIAPTRWTAVGLAAAAATAGVWLRVDAISREDDLLRSARNGAYRSVAEGRASSREAESIRSQANLGTGLLVGAGVAATTALVLYLVE